MLSEVLDRGLLSKELTSAKLMSQCLFMETNAKRYELTWYKTVQRTGTISQKVPGEGQTNTVHSYPTYVELYRWSECKRPLTLRELKSSELPLKDEELIDITGGTQQMEESTDRKKSLVITWDEILWLAEGVVVKGTKYNITKILFMQRSSTL